MNSQALFDGILALVAFSVAWQSAKAPALRLACAMLGAAALLGTLRFSGLLPLPSLHQLISMLGAAAALPLLAVSVIWPENAVATQRRSAWIFAVVAATLGMMIVVQLGFKPWAPACTLLAVVSLLLVSLKRQDWLAAAGGACLLAASLAFVAKLQLAGLQAGDFLHIGMSAGLWLLGRRAQQATATAARLSLSV